MSMLSAADEYFYHQIPEPLTRLASPHADWRESLFFEAHPRGGAGDVLVLTLAQFPQREMIDSLQMGRIDGAMIMARHERGFEDDPYRLGVGPVSIEIVEPFRVIRLKVDGRDAPVTLDLEFTARTQEYLLRRGTLRDESETLWDQRHMVQAGTYNGSYTVDGRTHHVDNWWGQRDHSWGIRQHARCPCWIWISLQFEDGMLNAWNWELANGAPIYLDGCFAPVDGSDPVSITGFQQDLHWLDESGVVTDYGSDGAGVEGLGGEFSVRLATGQTIKLSVAGRWHSRYGALGGGQQMVQVSSNDGRQGDGVIEITGAHHHHFFPVSRLG